TGRLHGMKRRMSAGILEHVIDSAAISELAAHFHLVSGNLPLQSDRRRLDALLKACRWTKSAPSRRLLRAQIEPFLTGQQTDVARREKVGWRRYFASFGNIGSQKALTTSLVLTAPGPGAKKGVPSCSFKYTWMRLAAPHDAAAVLRDYSLVGATSGARNDYASMMAFAGPSKDPFFIEISNLDALEP